MSTYQAASGAGAPGMAELEDGVTAAFKGFSSPRAASRVHRV